jgi:hypothetical protein
MSRIQYKYKYRITEDSFAFPKNPKRPCRNWRGYFPVSHRKARPRIHASPCGVCSWFFYKYFRFPLHYNFTNVLCFIFIYHRRCIIVDIDSELFKHRKEGLGISWLDEWLRLWEVLYVSCYLRGKVFPVNGVKAYRGRRVIFPLILNLDTEWRWVVNLAPRLFALEKEPQGRYLYVFIQRKICAVILSTCNIEVIASSSGIRCFVLP